MTMNKNVKKAGALVVIIAIVLVGTAGVISSGVFEKPAPVEPKPIFPKDHLNIDASFLLKTSETNESVNVSCDLYMTNIWEKESGEIKATAYVSERNTNFAVFKNTVEFGVIDANSTKELNVPVKFYDNSYKVEILLFESNKLFKKVTLTINSYQNYYYDYGGNITYNVGRTKEDADRDGQWSIVSGSTEVIDID